MFLFKGGRKWYTNTLYTTSHFFHVLQNTYKYLPSIRVELLYVDVLFVVAVSNWFVTNMKIDAVYILFTWNYIFMTRLYTRKWTFYLIGGNSTDWCTLNEFNGSIMEYRLQQLALFHCNYRLEFCYRCNLPSYFLF